MMGEKSGHPTKMKACFEKNLPIGVTIWQVLFLTHLFAPCWLPRSLLIWLFMPKCFHEIFSRVSIQKICEQVKTLEKQAIESICSSWRDSIWLEFTLFLFSCTKSSLVLEQEAEIMELYQKPSLDYWWGRLKLTY